jgi:hypothetical protein
VSGVRSSCETSETNSSFHLVELAQALVLVGEESLDRLGLGACRTLGLEQASSFERVLA